MAIGSAGTLTPGPVVLNAPQSAANVANQPAAVLDDSVNGSVVLHIGGKGAAPGCVVRIAGVGTGGTAVLDAGATDLCGLITIVTGSGAWGTGVQATVTYAVPHTLTNYPSISNASQATGVQAVTVQPSAVAVGLTGFTINFGVADGSAHTFVFAYDISGV